MGSLFKGRFIQKTQEKKVLPQNSQVWAQKCHLLPFIEGRNLRRRRSAITRHTARKS